MPPAGQPHAGGRGDGGLLPLPAAADRIDPAEAHRCPGQAGGGDAARFEVKVGASRGRLFDYRGIPLIVTYHPAYLLRNLTDKAKAWEDLCFMRHTS
jgi:hypothetical protein